MFQKANGAWAAGFLAALGSGAAAGDGVPAFPGAEGFGASARGGRGGKVVLVTNLHDYAPKREPAVPGSLRAACSLAGPRIVVFRVAGTISFQAPLRIDEPFIMIAGQTSPGDGICVRNHEVKVHTQHVVIRHMRFRPGDDPGAGVRLEGQLFTPDAWEEKCGLDSRNAADGNADEDADGYTNIEEWVNGTNPRASDAAAVPATATSAS